jgi:hypothetical protein
MAGTYFLRLSLFVKISEFKSDNLSPSKKFNTSDILVVWVCDLGKMDKTSCKMLYYNYTKGGKMEKDSNGVINAKGFEIAIVTNGGGDDYISLTDIAKYRSVDPNDRSELG